MNLLVQAVTRAIAETFDLPGPILVLGPTPDVDLKRLFPLKELIHVDRAPGLGVDLVADVEDLPYVDGWVGTVLALGTFARTRQFWRGLAEVRRILRPDGALLATCPFHAPIRHQSGDRWRWTPEALDELLSAYPSRLLGAHGPLGSPENIWALAMRERRPAITPRQFERYQRLMTHYFRQRLSWGQHLACRLIGWLAGPQLCAPILERDRWWATCHGMANAAQIGSVRPEATFLEPVAAYPLERRQAA
ncbi:MAG: class I SAM-dependent methyltransferase [Gemmataceae bacterium]|nr:class I SAM-dependent methyltransferase [Gemmataceae bacterium]